MKSYTEPSQTMKGININLLNSFLIAITAIVFFFILLISSNVNARFHAVKTAIDKFIICEQSSQTIKESSNELTELARLFIINEDKNFALAYLKEIEETRCQEKALHNLQQVCSEKDLALQRLNIAMTQAESLSNMELYAIRLGYAVIKAKESDIPQRVRAIEIRTSDKALSPQELKQVAIKNIFGEGYLIYKTRINENCKLTVQAIENQIKQELNLNADELGHNIDRLRMLFLVLLIVNVLVFIALAYLVLMPLKRFQTSIKNDQKLGVIGAIEFKNLAQSYNEIYEIKERNAQNLLRKAEYDALTGILNRRAFDQLCASSAEKQMSIALLLIDMDNFKHINDTYGHAGGDTALKELARILKKTFRKDDYIARIGGDEFAAILPDYKPDSLSRIIEKISEVNESLSHMKDGIKPVSISVGAAYSEMGFSEELYNQADKALYAVKEAGRRGCRIYDSSLE